MMTRMEMREFQFNFISSHLKLPDENNLFRR